VTITQEKPNDGRPNGWTEALALEWLAFYWVDGDPQVFADLFVSGCWDMIREEWIDFAEWADERAAQ
jgi:hypothetical protein